jgi:ribose 5-phosphate isomerase RpiB
LTDSSVAWMIIKKWLTTPPPSKARYQNRLKIIEKIEKENFK